MYASSLDIDMKRLSQMYVRVCVRVDTCACEYTDTVHTCTNVHICMYMLTHGHAQYTHTHHTHSTQHIYTTHTHTHTHTQDTHIHTHAYTTHTSTFTKHVLFYKHCVCMYLGPLLSYIPENGPLQRTTGIFWRYY